MSDTLFALFFVAVAVVIFARPEWSYPGRWMTGPDGRLSPVDRNLLRLGAGMGFAVAFAFFIYSQFVTE